MVHIAWHWIGAMYEAKTSVDINISKWRDKEKNVAEVQRSGVVL